MLSARGERAFRGYCARLLMKLGPCKQKLFKSGVVNMALRRALPPCYGLALGSLARGAVISPRPIRQCVYFTLLPCFIWTIQWLPSGLLLRHVSGFACACVVCFGYI